MLDARQTRQMSAGMKTYTREVSSRLPSLAADLEFLIFERGANFGFEEQVRLPLRIRAASADLTHFMSLYAPYFAPRPYLITIHDLIHLRFPQFFKSKVAPYYRSVVRHVAKNAARVITDDERTLPDLQRYLDVPPQRVRVVALGVAEVYVRNQAAHRAERPYFLYAGNHRPHKDLPTLLAAWDSLSPQIGADLYLTGNDDFGARSSLQHHGRAVSFLGDVTSRQLASLYGGAISLVHPSLCEGFGLTMLEAMAAGCCVISSRTACPAVLRPAALNFAAGDVKGLTKLMEKVFLDQELRTELVEKGRRLAKVLTWDRCALATAAVYREVLEERPSR
ncbi:MAG: glycosyltransferase family 4 protein [Candidatus Eremiobacteraeota bacterium]|nr:glycosyltransferase family 4 protein [Candidatus Eremiobacteraeota bacterium]